jgi:hypothetical protein
MRGAPFLRGFDQHREVRFHCEFALEGGHTQEYLDEWTLKRSEIGLDRLVVAVWRLIWIEVRVGHNRVPSALAPRSLFDCARYGV